MLLYCLYYIILLYYITYIALFILFILFVLYCYIIILYCYIILYFFCFRGKIEKYWRGLSRPKNPTPPGRISWDLCRTRPDRRQVKGDRFTVRLVQALQGAFDCARV